VDRASLARYMVQQARALYPDIEFHFDTFLQGLDGDNRVATFEDGSGARREEKFDMLVGADGANSAVRDQLAEQGSISYTREENARDYKSFLLPKELWDESPEYENKMLTWQSVDASVTRMWAVPTPDGTGQGMLTLYKGAFSELNSAQDYSSLLASKFAGVKPDMLDAIAKSCESAPVSGGGTMIKCSSLHSGAVVLVGDAGHSMFPALGQGCNSAIESAIALTDCLERSGGHLEQALPAYTNSRLDETSAAADLSAKVIDIDGSSGPLGTFRKAIFGLSIVYALLFNKLAPAIFKPPVLFQVNKVGASYVQLYKRSSVEFAVLSVVVLGFAAALASVMSKLGQFAIQLLTF